MAEEKKTTQAEAAVEATTDKPKREILPGGWNIPIPDGAEFGGLPEGTYITKCEEEPKETVSGKGEPQTEFTYVVHDEAFPDMTGKIAKYWCSRKPKAWWNIEQTLIAMDVPYEIIKNAQGKPVTFHFNPIQCVGQWEKVVVKPNKQPNGVTRNRVVQVISMNESAAESSGQEVGDVEETAPF